MSKLSIIIPCYFNEANIPHTAKRLLENEKKFPSDLEVEYVMVDDGSKDNTYNELLKFKELCPERVRIIKLVANVGSYNAIVAGMEYATGDCNVVLAADLQDPPELMARMYEYWLKGIKLVIGQRQERLDRFSDRMFATFFNSLMRRFAIKQLPKGGFDYVLFDKVLKDKVLQMNERNTNVLYLLLWLGYEFVCLPYTREKREVGVSRWTMSKKIKLFVDSFVSFSYFPLRVISVLGLLLGLGAFLYGLFIIVAKFSGLIPISGWSSMMLVLLFVSSFQMMALGIIGEYVWRSLDASRKRPMYIVDKVD